MEPNNQKTDLANGGGGNVSSIIDSRHDHDDRSD
jgi:hypothetical protein